MTYRLAPEVAFEALGDAAVLLHLGHGQYYQLNAVASRAVENIEKERSQLLTLLGGEFEVPEPTLEADISTLFDELLKLGLVEQSA